MDGSRFDAWTRRQFGLTIGTGLATLLSLSRLEDAEAKKKKRKRKRKRKKKRCKKVEDNCQGDVGSKGGCCKGLRCAPLNGGGNHCCHSFEGDSCSGGGCCLDLECIDGTCQLP